MGITPVTEDKPITAPYQCSVDIPKGSEETVRDADKRKDDVTAKEEIPHSADIPNDGGNKDTKGTEEAICDADKRNDDITNKDIANEETTHSSDTRNGGVTGESASNRDVLPSSRKGKPRKLGLYIFVLNISRVLKLDELGSEVARIAVPAALALAADPVASLIDTIFVGRLGATEIAAVGVSIAVFNQVSKVAIYPLVSVTTSFVAEEDALCSQITEDKRNEDLEKASSVDGEMEVADPSAGNELEESPSFAGQEKTESKIPRASSKRTNTSKVGRKRRYIPSVSSALVVGAVLGLLMALLLTLGAKIALKIMGVGSDSPMLAPAVRYLTLRSIGAPAVLLSLAMQGVFRGFKDTQTPLYATVAGDVTNIILDPLLIFVCHMGVSGAAIAHVLSQYLITIIMLFKLVRQVDVIPPSIRALKISRFLTCGFMLLARVIAVTFCVTLAASLAAHNGPVPMAAFQICLQVWMSSSLLADGLAVAGQAIIASAFARDDKDKVLFAAARVLQLSIVLGLVLAFLLAMLMQFGAGIFTNDVAVVKIIHKAVPFIAATQPINSLAFVYDGVNFGASDYTFSAYSMVAVAAVSIPCEFYLAKHFGFIGIWTSLTVYMTLRMLTSVWRMGAARGPWSFVRK